MDIVIRLIKSDRGLAVLILFSLVVILLLALVGSFVGDLLYYVVFPMKFDFTFNSGGTW